MMTLVEKGKNNQNPARTTVSRQLYPAAERLIREDSQPPDRGVAASAVIERLNDCFDNEWTFVILRREGSYSASLSFIIFIILSQPSFVMIWLNWER